MVHVVWCDTRYINPQVYYIRSTSGGEEWQDEIQLCTTESNAENPGVSIAGVMNPVVHVVWDDDRDENKEIYYKRSSDWGVTWSDDIRLTDTPDASVRPNLHGCVCCGTDVRIAWVEEQNSEADIFYKYSDDNGLTWSDNIPITDDDHMQDDPNLTFCRADVQVVWTDFRNGKAEVWGRHSTDCGATWSAELCLSDPKLPWAGFPMIAHFDSTYYIVWLAQVDSSVTPHHDIFYRRTQDLGITWESVVRLTAERMVYWPLLSCAAMGKNFHITWVQLDKGVFYKRSLDQGETWERDTCLVTGVKAENPALAVAGERVHIVWYEKKQEGTDVYYMRNPTGNPVDFKE